MEKRVIYLSPTKTKEDAAVRNIWFVGVKLLWVSHTQRIRACFSSGITITNRWGFFSAYTKVTHLWLVRTKTEDFWGVRKSKELLLLFVFKVYAIELHVGGVCLTLLWALWLMLMWRYCKIKIAVDCGAFCRDQTSLFNLFIWAVSGTKSNTHQQSFCAHLQQISCLCLLIRLITVDIKSIPTLWNNAFVCSLFHRTVKCFQSQLLRTLIHRQHQQPHYYRSGLARAA